jgi:hypothetical protein
MTLRAGEVVLIRIDFHQTPGGKMRPAVVLLDSGDDDFVAGAITNRAQVCQPAPHPSPIPYPNLPRAE